MAKRLTSGGAGTAPQVRVPKTAELVAGQIRRQIIRGDIEEGDALLPESELMSQFGVSRPTLREAFRILESESLITVTRGARGGARVHGPHPSVAARYAGLILQYQRATLEDVQAARAILEPPAAAMLARRRSSKATEELRELCDQEDVAIDDPQTFAELSTRFHERVMELAGNQSLALLVSMLHDIIQSHAASSMEASNNPKSRRRAVRSQRKLLDLVEAGDVEGAEDHWRAHVKGAGRAILDAAGAKTVLDLFN